MTNHYASQLNDLALKNELLRFMQIAPKLLVTRVGI